ncbi:MAG: GNAT family N-acetyltransferase [Burkholderiales bacterium]
MEIRALRADDERSGFSCGDEHLDRFFRTFAGQNQFRHHLGVTYVAVEGAAIWGFATVAPAHIEIDALPAVARKKLPNYPLPVLRLARLAVEHALQSKGIGAQLLRFVLKLSLEMDGAYGCAGVVVDAKESALPFYAKYGFTPLEPVEGQSEARPRHVPMFLSINQVRDANQ